MHQVDPSSKLIGSNFDLGSQWSKGFLQKRGDLVHPPNLTRALGKGRMSSFFLSFFLSFSQSASSSTCLIRFLPNLVRSKYGWMATKLMGLKIHAGSFGVNRGQKCHFTKNATLLQITGYGHVTNLSCNGLTHFTKVMV